MIVENRSLKAELQELQQKVKNLLHQNNELKKQVIKEMVRLLLGSQQQWEELFILIFGLDERSCK